LRSIEDPRPRSGPHGSIFVLYSVIARMVTGLTKFLN